MKIKMRNRVAFWGLGELFRNEYARIMHWEQQGDIEIVAYIDKNGKPRKLDDITVLLPEEISTCGIQIDYIIVTTIAWNDVLQIAQKNGIPREKLVHPKIFSIPHFKISYYLSIRKSPLSLIAPDCIGGVLLHRIDLPFCSPFVNVRVGSSIWDYYGLLDRLPEYMNMSPSKEAKNMNRNILKSV